MLEECVECLMMAGQREKAKELAEKLLASGVETPQLLFLMGDITKDINYYKKSWKISKRRFYRSQKALARIYFYQNKLEQSIKAFRKSIAVNSYQSDSYFTMGCAYLKLNDLDNAISCFSSVVSIDESQ